jgi:pimeloyl-ACP methyl ester carboxylesterase
MFALNAKYSKGCLHLKALKPNYTLLSVEIKKEDEFQYIDEGQGEVLLLLHGLFGALSNWSSVTNYFSKNYRVIIPLMPIYEMPLKDAGLEGLYAFIQRFIAFKKLDKLTLIGNSLGGHVALIYTLRQQHMVKRLILTGSSGLYENTMGGSFPKRGSYDYIQERVGYTFYSPEVATKDLVDEVFEVTRSIPKCKRMIVIARSAQRHNMAHEIHDIKVPTQLIWGLNDTITPPVVAHEFDRRIANTELRFIDRCGHAPMMEHPALFNSYVSSFLQKHQLVH